MTDTSPDPSEQPRKRRKTAFLLWVILAAAGAGGGFYTVRSGLIPGLGGQADHESHAGSAASDGTHGEDGGNAAEDVVFLPVEPLMISLNGGADREHLRFRAELEVVATRADEVTHLMPRIVDLLNGYLRALEVTDLQAPAALTRLRAQMLRRINVVAGPGRVRDLLIMEFVLN